MPSQRLRSSNSCWFNNCVEEEEEIAGGGCCCRRCIRRWYNLFDCRGYCGGSGWNCLPNFLLPQGPVNKFPLPPNFCEWELSFVIVVKLVCMLGAGVQSVMVQALCDNQGWLWGRMRQERTRHRLCVLVAMALASSTKLTNRLFVFYIFHKIWNTLLSSDSFLFLIKFRCKIY